MDVHILVNPDISITAAHAIAESLEEALACGLPRPVNIMVHGARQPATEGLRRPRSGDIGRLKPPVLVFNVSEAEEAAQDPAL